MMVRAARPRTSSLTHPLDLSQAFHRLVLPTGNQQVPKVLLPQRDDGLRDYGSGAPTVSRSGNGGLFAAATASAGRRGIDVTVAFHRGEKRE